MKRHYLAPTDIPNPMEPGEPLYVDYYPRPLLYHFIRAVWLFLRIVGRVDQSGGRMSASTALQVCKIVWGRP